MPKPDEETGLTEQQLSFCRHYARTFNAGDSYAKAGYKFRTPAIRDANAWRLVRDEKVQAYLAGILDVDETKIVSAVSAIALCPITEIIKWDGAELIVQQSDAWSERAKLAVKKITTKQTYDPKTGALSSSTTSVELNDRLSALDKLMRMLSMYPTGQTQDHHIDNPQGEIGISHATIDEDAAINSSPAGRFFRDITGVSLSAAALSKTMDGGSIAVED
jgi:hypothetical protein